METTLSRKATSQNRGLIDRVALLDRTGGDEDLLREISAIFLTEYPILIEEIQFAVRTGDANRLEQAAHSLKGSVSNFGALAATEAAYRLEAIARKLDLAGSAAALGDLLIEFQQLRPELEVLSRSSPVPPPTTVL
jgi:HPt (histidine-containing phosphotransfer) domain-containing protein